MGIFTQLKWPGGWLHEPLVPARLSQCTATARVTHSEVPREACTVPAEAFRAAPGQANTLQRTNTAARAHKQRAMSTCDNNAWVGGGRLLHTDAQLSCRDASEHASIIAELSMYSARGQMYRVVGFELEGGISTKSSGGSRGQVRGQRRMTERTAPLGIIEFREETLARMRQTSRLLLETVWFVMKERQGRDLP